MPHRPDSSDTTIVVRKNDGNPEGKGLNGLLLDLRRSEPRGVVAKPHRQILAETFTSMLVLSAAFKYRPAIGVENYLYWQDDEWSLSLIAPGEWSIERHEGFAGTCVLQQDMTWTIAPSPLLAKGNSPAADALARYYEAFARLLDTDFPLEDVLPFHAGQLPYYQRLYANALSRSVLATVTLGAQTSTGGRQWRSLLPRDAGPLLAFGG
jgi:hypothetical protein